MDGHDRFDDIAGRRDLSSLHRLAVNKRRLDSETQTFLARRSFSLLTQLNHKKNALDPALLLT